MSQPPDPAGADPESPAADRSATTSDDPAAPGGPFDGVTGILGILPLEAASDPLVGCTIGDVEIVAALAEGGMGRVYEGRQRSPSRAVAVKVLRPGFITPEGVKRFAREAEVLGSLRHPNIAQVFWAGACDILGSKVPFIIMELVPGALPITEYVLTRGLVEPARLDLFRKVAAAVAHGHAAGIVHRDLKPGNVLVDSSGEPKLIDFGIARLVEASGEATALTEFGRMVGTVQYMSPEQVTGDAAAVDRRSDVYSLGLLLHELVTGRRPYEIDPRRVFDAPRIIRERKPVASVVADGRRPDLRLARVLENCLHLDPAARYADALGLLAALDSARADTSATVSSPPSMRSWFYAGVAVSLVAVVLLWRQMIDGFGVRYSEPRMAAGVHPKPVPAVRSVDLTMEAVMKATPIDGTIYLADYTHVTADVAEALVGRGQGIRMDHLAVLDPHVAAILGRNRRGLNFGGLKTISAEVAAGLVQTRGALCLDGVASLDIASARVLATHRDWLNLVGLRELPAEVLMELVMHRGPGMAIRVPGTLNAKRAAMIAQHTGNLYLVGLEAVDEDAARILKTHRGPIHVDAARVTPEVDRLLGGGE